MNKRNSFGWLLSILSIMFGGFLLFNIAFVGLALVINGLRMQGGDQNFDFTSTLLIFLGYSAAFGILMFGLKKLLSKVEFKTILNATFLTLVLMASLVLIGIMFHDNSLLIVIVSLIFMIPILIFMISKKLHYWYIFSWSFVLVLGALIYFFDIQI
jgi:hypothetical protein